MNYSQKLDAHITKEPEFIECDLPDIYRYFCTRCEAYHFSNTEIFDIHMRFMKKFSMGIVKKDFLNETFNININYQITDEESLKCGDFKDQGPEAHDCLPVSKIIDLINNKGFTELSCSDISDLRDKKNKCYVWLMTADPEINYKTDEETFYSLHIDCTNDEFYNICKLAGIIKVDEEYKSYQETAKKIS